MNRLLLSLCVSVTLLTQGCYFGLLPKPTSTAGTSPFPKLPDDSLKERKAGDQSPIASEVFRAPSLENAGQDSRVIQGSSASDTLGTQLNVIRTRLADLRTAYDSKGTTEADLLQATDKLKSLAILARSDCDLILRVARDQKAELPFHKRSYEATADYYREKAKKYKTKNFQALNIEFADKFERLAEDIPRRRRLTEAFIEQLIEMQDFLAETERCLADTKVALSILSVGSKTIQLNGETVHFRKHLENFLGAVDEYQRRFFEMPLVSPEKPKPTSDEPEEKEEIVPEKTRKGKPKDEADKINELPKQKPAQRREENKSIANENAHEGLASKSINPQPNEIKDEPVKKSPTPVESFNAVRDRNRGYNRPQPPGEWRPVSATPKAVVIETREPHTPAASVNPVYNEGYNRPQQPGEWRPVSAYPKAAVIETRQPYTPTVPVNPVYVVPVQTVRTYEPVYYSPQYQNVVTYYPSSPIYYSSGPVWNGGCPQTYYQAPVVWRTCR